MSCQDEAYAEYFPQLNIREQADVLIIIGTSLAVYPAAGLLYYAPSNAEIYVIDPKQPGSISRRVTYITEKATVGMKQLYDKLMA